MESRERFKLFATCQENSIAESSQNHTPSIQLSFIVTGSFVPEHENMKGAQLRADLWLTQDCTDRTFKTLEECFNWTGDDITEIHSNRHLFKDQKVSLTCEIEEWDGEPRVKVAFVNPVSRLFSIKKEKLGEIAPALNNALAKFRANTKSARRTAADLANAPADGTIYPTQEEKLPF